MDDPFGQFAGFRTGGLKAGRLGAGEAIDCHLATLTIPQLQPLPGITRMSCFDGNNIASVPPTDFHLPRL